ncbi:hypothetical protein JCM15060_00050 [Halanaerobaculum tunisiense]
MKVGVTYESFRGWTSYRMVELDVANPRDVIRNSYLIVFNVRG